MTPKNRKILAARVSKAATEALAARHYVTCVDVLVGMGWLDPEAVKRWRKGQVPYLERVVVANLSRISVAMKLFRSWSNQRGLTPSETKYVAHTRGRPPLRFSKSGNPHLERQYRTHWVSREFLKKERERPAKTASRAAEAELAAVQQAENERSDAWDLYEQWARMGSAAYMSD